MSTKQEFVYLDKWQRVLSQCRNVLKGNSELKLHTRKLKFPLCMARVHRTRLFKSCMRRASGTYIIIRHCSVSPVRTKKARCARLVSGACQVTYVFAQTSETIKELDRLQKFCINTGLLQPNGRTILFRSPTPRWSLSIHPGSLYFISASWHCWTPLINLWAL